MGGTSTASEVTSCTYEHPCVQWPNISESGTWLNDAIEKAKVLVAQVRQFLIFFFPIEFALDYVHAVGS